MVVDMAVFWATALMAVVAISAPTKWVAALPAWAAPVQPSVRWGSPPTDVWWRWFSIEGESPPALALAARRWVHVKRVEVVGG